MSLRLLRTIRLLNCPILTSTYKVNHKLVNKFSTLTIDPTVEKKELKDEKKDLGLAKEDDKLLEEDEDEEIPKENVKPKKKERYAVNTYEHNPPGLMEFFDDPKNWGEDYVKSGRSWKVEELRNKSNTDLHKLWYVLLKERNMLLTMEEAYKSAGQVLASEERIFKVNDSMKNLEQVVRERNKAYWQLEVDQNETGERPVAFRKDIYGRFRWITCSEHLVPIQMNKKWKIFSGIGTGRHVYEFMRRYREKLVSRRASRLQSDAFEVRQLLRRFPRMDMEALQEKYPDIDIEAQKSKFDEDKPYRKIISKWFDPKFR